MDTTRMNSKNVRCRGCGIQARFSRYTVLFASVNGAQVGCPECSYSFWVNA
ncbi:hypothetical protein AB0K05_12980 [Nonomuraea sp. NPDC049486]|uniref:hypothetical protein n=1 Tax=Nonomuraea sp. NPDC049486 TaxID=3155773 RepID=UPI003444D55E